MIKHVNFIKSNEISLFSLRFKRPELEADFLKDYIKNSLFQTRLAIVLACTAFIAFYYHDTLLNPQTIIISTLIRFGIIVPLGIFVYWLTYKPMFIRYGYMIMSVIIFGGGVLVILFLMVKPNNTVSYAHFNDLMYIFIFTFVIARITFVNSLALCLLLFLIFEFLTIFILNQSYIETVNSNYYVLFSLIFSALAGYVSEFKSREEYITRKLLENEKEKSINASVNLEKIVKERTKELLLVNKDLKNEKLKAEGSERLKSAFLANISHEIRTPLTQIIGFSELIAKANITKEKREQYTEYLDKNANQLLQIISDIIKLSEIEAKEFQIQRSDFQLKKFLEEIEHIAIEERHKQNKEQIELTIITSGLDANFTINSDKTNLRQAFVNVINNAFKYTERGQITITYRLRNDQMVEFCIKDTGKGIDEENTEMIFDHFTQEDTSSTRGYGGAGLGLAITKGIILRLGGKIWVRSIKNQGSSFYFTVAITDNSQPRSDIFSKN